MNNRILFGIFAILGLAGLGFAWGGFFGHPFAETLPDDVQEQFKEAMEDRDFETLRALREEYFPQPNVTMSEDVLELREQIHEAMEAGDYETAQELRDEMLELLPENAGPMFGHMRGFGPRMGGGLKGPGPRGPHPDCPCMGEQ